MICDLFPHNEPPQSHGRGKSVKPCTLLCVLCVPADKDHAQLSSLPAPMSSKASLRNVYISVDMSKNPNPQKCGTKCIPTLSTLTSNNVCARGWVCVCLTCPEQQLPFYNKYHNGPYTDTVAARQTSIIRAFSLTTGLGPSHSS